MGDGIDRGEVGAGEIEIAGIVPVRCEIGGAAGCGGEGAELAGGGLALRFREIVVEGAGGKLGKLGEDGGFEFIALFRGALGGDGDEALLVRTDPCPGGDFQRELLLIAEMAMEAARLPTAEDGG